MKRLATVLLVMLWSAAASAAGVCPNVTQSDPGLTAGGSVFGRLAAQWNSYFGAKVDVNNGTLCNPTIVGSTANLITNLVPGGPLFGGTTGAIAQDLANLSWNPTTKLLTAKNIATDNLTAANLAFTNITATRINKVAITPPLTGSTLTIADNKTLTANSTLALGGADNKTLTVNNSLTFSGIDGTTMTFPTTSKTLLANDASNAAVSTVRTNLGLGTTDNVTFGTGIFSKTHASITGIGATLEGIYVTGATAPTTNLGGVQGFVSIDTPASATNNQSANFFVGGLFTAQGTVANNGVGTITLTGTAAAAATTLQVSSITGVRNGDAILVTLDSGVLFSTLVNGIPSGSNVPILPAIPTQATSGNNVYDYSGEVQGVIMAGGLKPGATKWYASVGMEASTTVEAGSSVFFKCTICASNNATDVVQADGPWDMMYGASGTSGSVGAKVGLGFGPWSGVKPIQTTGTLIKTFGADTIANGIDLSSYTISANAWKSTGITINGLGQIISTNVVSSGVLRTTGVEASQIQMANGGQDWLINSQSAAGGGSWYLNDSTNSKIPLSIARNATKALTLGTATMTYNGNIINSGITSDATHTDSTVCVESGTFQFYYGSGAAGICLGTSSLRFKRDVGALSYGLDDVMRLEPIHYRYKPDSGHDSERELFGFAAEQVNEVMPKLVGLDPEGRPNSVDWAGLVPVLVKAIQEQQAEIADLKRHAGR